MLKLTPCKDIDLLCIATLRSLVIDMIYNAKSGHLGSALGMASTAHFLFTQFLTISAHSPTWPNRDRFVLSNGHSCALLYSLLHLLNFPFSTHDLQHFRRLGSNCPGHPQLTLQKDGIEATTGALGQGIGSAVGMAMALKHLAAVFNRPGCQLFDNKVVVFLGDGDMMEGVTYETCSLAGHLQLDNLVAIFDDNKTTIDGKVDLTFSEDFKKRFESCGWETHCIKVDENDLNSLKNALENSIQSETKKPRILFVSNTIGIGTSSQGTAKSHGNNLTHEEYLQLKAEFGRQNEALKEPFKVPPEVLRFYDRAAQRSRDQISRWKKALTLYKGEHPDRWTEFKRIFIEKTFSPKLETLFERWGECSPSHWRGLEDKSTREIGGKVFRQIFDAAPEIFGGAADLANSCRTNVPGEPYFSKECYGGRLVAFGAREHGMLAVANGIVSCGLIPFTATFATFLLYGYSALRICALNRRRQIVVLSHDSIALGQDGPSHMPLETFQLVRSNPSISLYRPYNHGETAAAYKSAFYATGPTVICVAKKRLFLQREHKRSFSRARFGAYPFYTSDGFEGAVLEANRRWEKGRFGRAAGVKAPLLLVATGQEVGLALESAFALERWFGLNVRVVSAPSPVMFSRQSVEYRLRTVPLGALVVAIETSAAFGWAEWSHFSISLESLPGSGRPLEVMGQAGFSLCGVLERIWRVLNGVRRETDAGGRSLKEYLGTLKCQR